MLEDKVKDLDSYIILYAAAFRLSELLDISFQKAKDMIIEDALIFNEISTKE